MRSGNTIVKERSAQAMVLLSDAPKLRLRIAECGGINALIQLLQMGSSAAKIHAACAIANLAGHERCQVLIGERGGLLPLLELLRNGSCQAKGNAAQAIALLAMKNDANEKELVDRGAVPALQELLRSVSRDSALAQKAASALEVLHH